ncbi:LysR family transcriptional regulator [Rhizobium sp. BK512]|uniref:LysR family transcriptional regulator n=2 Tax=unclassified Rhizobium TaxID=2613769 RepID=UPI001622A877
MAEAGSFSEAVRRLGMTPSAVSQAVKSLEAKLGAPLLRRSTRSVSLTDVGSDYLAVAAPALSALRRAADDAAGRGGRPSGPLKLTMSRAPFDMMIGDALVAFKDAYPQVQLEIAVEAKMVDIVKEGYDAGLRYGGSISKEMVAVRVAPESEAVLVASEQYLSSRGTPQDTTDLMTHRCVLCRSQVSGLLLPWRLDRGSESFDVTPVDATIVHDLASQIDLAAKGIGIVLAPIASVERHLASGDLVRVLPEWSSRREALFLYSPSRRHQSAALRAFVAFLSKPNAQI